MSVSSRDQVATGDSDAADGKTWFRLRERWRGFTFAAAAAVAMVGWLYLLAEGLWAVARLGDILTQGSPASLKLESGAQIVKPTPGSKIP